MSSFLFSIVDWTRGLQKSWRRLCKDIILRTISLGLSTKYGTMRVLSLVISLSLIKFAVMRITSPYVTSVIVVLNLGFYIILILTILKAVFPPNYRKFVLYVCPLLCGAIFPSPIGGQIVYDLPPIALSRYKTDGVQIAGICL